MQARRDRAEVRPLHDRLLEPQTGRLPALRLQHRLRRRRLLRPGDGAVRVPAGRHRAELRPLSGLWDSRQVSDNAQDEPEPWRPTFCWRILVILHRLRSIPQSCQQKVVFEVLAAGPLRLEAMVKSEYSMI